MHVANTVINVKQCMFCILCQIYKRNSSKVMPVWMNWCTCCERSYQGETTYVCIYVKLSTHRDISYFFKLDCITRILQKVLSLGSDYFSATFYQTYFYYKPSKYSPFTETHFCNLFTQSRKADK